MVTLVLHGSLVDRQVGLVVPFQIAHEVGAVVAALMVTLVPSGSLVGVASR